MRHAGLVLLISLSAPFVAFADTCITAQHFGTLLHVYVEGDAFFHAYALPGTSIDELQDCLFHPEECEMVKCAVESNSPLGCKGDDDFILDLNCYEIIVEQCTADFTFIPKLPKIIQLDLHEEGPCE